MKSLKTMRFGQFVAAFSLSMVVMSFAQAKDVAVSVNLTGKLQEVDTLAFGDATLVKWRNTPALTPATAFTIEALAADNSPYPVRANSKNLANDQGFIFSDNAIKVDFTGRTNKANSAVVVYTKNAAGRPGLVGTGSNIPLIFKTMLESDLKAAAAEDVIQNTGVFMPNFISNATTAQACVDHGPYKDLGTRTLGFCDYQTRFVTNINDSTSFRNAKPADVANAFAYASIVNNKGVVSSENGSSFLGRTGPAYLVLGAGTEDALPVSYSTTVVVEKVVL